MFGSWKIFRKEKNIIWKMIFSYLVLLWKYEKKLKLIRNVCILKLFKL